MARKSLGSRTTINRDRTLTDEHAQVHVDHAMRCGYMAMNTYLVDVTALQLGFPRLMSGPGRGSKPWGKTLGFPLTWRCPNAMLPTIHREGALIRPGVVLEPAHYLARLLTALAELPEDKRLSREALQALLTHQALSSLSPALGNDEALSLDEFRAPLDDLRSAVADALKKDLGPQDRPESSQQELDFRPAEQAPLPTAALDNRRGLCSSGALRKQGGVALAS